MSSWALSSSLLPQEPKFNGHVERMQRTFREEFYTQPLPTKILELQRELSVYLGYYNRQRPHPGESQR